MEEGDDEAGRVWREEEMLWRWDLSGEECGMTALHSWEIPSPTEREETKKKKAAVLVTSEDCVFVVHSVQTIQAVRLSVAV